MEEILRTNSCRELDWQVSFACIAMKDLREALTEMDQAARDFRSQREWFDVGSWTTLHAEFDRRRSAATRRFWYSAQGFLLAVTRLMERAVRNHLERFDEGPDPWAEYRRGNSENGAGMGTGARRRASSTPETGSDTTIRSARRFPSRARGSLCVSWTTP